MNKLTLQIHGRPREERNTRLDGWDFIEYCAKTEAPVPVYGTGDLISYDDYQRCQTLSSTVHFKK